MSIQDAVILGIIIALVLMIWWVVDSAADDWENRY
jgi:hypothetical protein